MIGGDWRKGTVLCRRSAHMRLTWGQSTEDSPRERALLRRADRGYAILAVLLGLSVVTLAAGLGLRYLLNLRAGHVSRRYGISAGHLAEGGLAKARWELARGNVGYRGEQGLVIGKGAVDIGVQPTDDAGGYLVTATGRATRGSGALSRCTNRARVRRLASGAVQLCSWSQVRPGKSLPSATASTPKSVDTR